MALDPVVRAAEARAKLLRAERLPGSDDGSPQRGRAFVLTFDVGRILVAAASNGVGLDTRPVDSRDGLPVGLEPVDEEEPWWRLLGAPLTEAWPGAAGASAVSTAGAAPDELRLQFRESDENPRVVSLRLSGGAVLATLEVTDA